MMNETASMEEVTVNVAKNFSDIPYGRDINDGPDNGKRFREEHLTPHLKQNKIVVIEMSEAMGYGSSFLDEAFGGLVRDDGFTPEFLHSHIIPKHHLKSVEKSIWNYIDGVC